MFYVFNSNEFGNKLKEIRTSLRFSQLFVSDSIKISVEGLRKIENGYVTPKFETLVKLSVIYKTNLIRIMSDYSISPDIQSLYNQAQNLIDTENTTDLEKLILDVNESINNSTKLGVIVVEELSQFQYFCNGALYFIKKDYNSLNKAKDLIIEALKKTLINFKVSKITNFTYSNFEKRNLHLLALIERRLGNYYITIDIINFLLKNADYDDVDSENIKLINQLYFSLSYSFHEISNYEMSLKIADQGIEFSKTKLRLNELYFLYYRKGIAEYFLSIDTFQDSLSKSILLLDLLDSPLANVYRTITQKKYGIIIN